MWCKFVHVTPGDSVPTRPSLLHRVGGYTSCGLKPPQSSRPLPTAHYRNQPPENSTLNSHVHIPYRGGNNFQGVEDFDLKARVKIWPWRAGVCHIRSTAVPTYTACTAYRHHDVPGLGGSLAADTVLTGSGVNPAPRSRYGGAKNDRPRQGEDSAHVLGFVTELSGCGKTWPIQRK